MTSLLGCAPPARTSLTSSPLAHPHLQAAPGHSALARSSIYAQDPHSSQLPPSAFLESSPPSEKRLCGLGVAKQTEPKGRLWFLLFFTRAVNHLLCTDVTTTHSTGQRQQAGLWKARFMGTQTLRGSEQKWGHFPSSSPPAISKQQRYVIYIISEKNRAQKWSLEQLVHHTRKITVRKILRLWSVSRTMEL